LLKTSKLLVYIKVCWQNNTQWKNVKIGRKTKLDHLSGNKTVMSLFSRQVLVGLREGFTLLLTIQNLDFVHVLTSY